MTEWLSKIQNTQIQIPSCIKLPTTFFFTLTNEMLIYFSSDAVLTLVEMVAASPDLEGIKAPSTLTPSTLASTLQQRGKYSSDHTQFWAQGTIYLFT